MKIVKLHDAIFVLDFASGILVSRYSWYELMVFIYYHVVHTDKELGYITSSSSFTTCFCPIAAAQAPTKAALMYVAGSECDESPLLSLN